jgi:hypothetical protein
MNNLIVMNVVKRFANSPTELTTANGMKCLQPSLISRSVAKNQQLKNPKSDNSCSTKQRTALLTQYCILFASNCVPKDVEAFIGKSLSGAVKI